MCFTEFCARYALDDPPGNAAYCWKCALEVYPASCEDELLYQMEQQAAGAGQESKAAGGEVSAAEGEVSQPEQELGNSTPSEVGSESDEARETSVLLGGCVEVVHTGSQQTSPVHQAAAVLQQIERVALTSDEKYPRLGTRVVIEGRCGLVFGLQPRLPESLVALIAFDAEPVFWKRLELTEMEGEGWWTPLVDDGESECAVHAVLRSRSGVRLPEAYLLGPSVQNTLTDARNTSNGWSLFAAYVPAVQTLDSAMVAKAKQQGSYRLGDHVRFSELVPVGLGAKDQASQIPSEGEGFVYGFVVCLDTSCNQMRRYAIVCVDDCYCFATIECISPGSKEKNISDRWPSIKAQRDTLEELLVSRITRTPAAVNSAMDRERRVRLAENATEVCVPTPSAVCLLDTLSQPLCVQKESDKADAEGEKESESDSETEKGSDVEEASTSNHAAGDDVENGVEREGVRTRSATQRDVTETPTPEPDPAVPPAPGGRGGRGKRGRRGGLKSNSASGETETPQTPQPPVNLKGWGQSRLNTLPTPEIKRLMKAHKLKTDACVSGNSLAKQLAVYSLMRKVGKRALKPTEAGDSQKRPTRGSDESKADENTHNENSAVTDETVVGPKRRSSERSA